MGRLLFMFLPWWAFAFFAFTCGSLAIPFYDDYRAAQTEQFFALNEGPPAAVHVGEFQPNRHVGYFEEVHITGTILGNFGVLRLHGEGTDYDAVVLGGDARLPRAILMFDSLSSERKINELISAADANNSVTVQGFLTNARRTEAERELTRRGYSGVSVLTVEPYFENRAAVLNEKVTDAQLTFFIVAGLAALFAVIALWRFRRWRKRRAAKKLRRATQRGQPMPTPAAQPAPNPVQSTAAKPAQPTTPWGGTTKPNQQAQQPAKRRRTPQPEPDLQSEIPDFKSVFPGGGSGFRFKTSDEIVRQYFGSITDISRANSDS